MKKILSQNEQVNQCHPELDSGSHINMTETQRFRIKSGMTDVSGRSMVEMLGVLAIIGVLSIMGIAGYRSAMTKLRSNELLNEASKRAVVVAGQITLQGGNPSLSEFANNSFAGGTFENSVYGASGATTWTNTDKQFTLSITGVEGNICEQMKSAAEDNAVIQTFAPTTCDTGNDNNVKLTYNNDLSTDTIPSGDDVVDTEVCDNGHVYLAYMDDPCGTETPMDGDCTKNSDCKTGEYCNMESQSSDCSKPDIGQCVEIGTVNPVNIAGIGDVVTSIPQSMTWWSANNFCKAQQKSLLEVSDLNCYQSGTNVPLSTSNLYDGIGCCAENKSCRESSNWYTTTNYSPIYIAIRNEFGSNSFFWLKNPDGTCRHYFMRTLYGHFLSRQNDYPSGDQHDSRYAMCK